MLYHQKRIADIGQMAKSRQKFVVILLMQSDARFVQNVEDAYQTGTDLSSQADSLRLPPDSVADERDSVR